MIFDSQVGTITNIYLRQLNCAGKWALAAAAQNGSWWRCQFDSAAIQGRCQQWQKADAELQKAAAEKTEAERLEAQQAFKGRPAQQQADKQQQQQQFLRRLLMPTAFLEDEQSAGDQGTAAAMGIGAKRCAQNYNAAA